MNLFVLRTWLQAKFAKDERGASMVEYILLVALIALAVIAAVVFLRGQVQRQVQRRGLGASRATAADLRPRQDIEPAGRSSAPPASRPDPVRRGARSDGAGVRLTSREIRNRPAAG